MAERITTYLTYAMKEFTSEEKKWKFLIVNKFSS